MDEPKFGYMCKTEYDWEVGEALGASRIYCSVDDLKNNRKCVENCGIVKVKIEMVEIVQPENRNWTDTTKLVRVDLGENASKNYKDNLFKDNDDEKK
jgi:hypothetical protein